MESLTGKVAVVTGAARGLGAASAARLARAGAHVVAVDRDSAGLEAVLASLVTPGVAVCCDVASEADVDTYMRRAIDAFGRVDLHHLNAGIAGSAAPLPELTVEEFDAVMGVNLRGAFLGVRAAFRQYRAQETGGAIVITASIASLRGSADLLPYHVSKHGVLGLLRGAAVYGGPLGVRVNAVAPGIVPTELFAADPAAKDDMVRRASTTPLRRAGTPEDVAAVVEFLLGPGAAYMTGEVVSVDGGATAVNPVRSSGGAGAWDTGPIDRYAGLKV